MNTTTSVAGIGMTCRHNLAYHGDTLLFGTHEGRWEQAPGQAAKAVPPGNPDSLLGVTADGGATFTQGVTGH